MGTGTCSAEAIPRPG